MPFPSFFLKERISMELHTRLIICCVLSFNLLAADNIHSCHNKCSHWINDSAIMVKSHLRRNGYVQCVMKCSQQGNTAKEHIILGPNDMLPNDLHMTDKIPEVPKILLFNGEKQEKTECDDVPFSSDETKCPGPAVDVFVKCKTNGIPRLSITWRSPKEGTEYLKGYQIVYRFLKNPGYTLKDGCKIVNQSEREFTIDERMGLKSGPVNIRVLPLPLKRSFSVPVKQYEGCEGLLQRKKREVLKTGAPSFSGHGPRRKVLVLKPGATIPPHLLPGILKKFFGTESPLKPFETRKSCRRPEISRNGTVIEEVQGIFLKCENQTGKYPLVFAHWDVPSGKGAGIEGFQVHYSIMKPNNYDPRRQHCHEVGKMMRATQIEVDDIRIPVYINIVPLPMYSGQQTKLKEHMIDCRIEKDNANGQDEIIKKKHPEKLDMRMVLGGLIAGVILVAIIAALMHRRWKRKKTFCFKGIHGIQSGSAVYFSHYTKSRKDERKLLTFASRICDLYGIKPCIDLLEERKIDELTLPVWLNSAMQKCDKIVVVIGKKYLKIWTRYISNCTDNGYTGDSYLDDRRIRKIAVELSYIQQHLLERGERTKRVICLLDNGVRENDLPDFLRRRRIFKWPTDGSEMERNFVRCLQDKEEKALGGKKTLSEDVNV